MHLLILGMNYAPEQTGIGPYTSGLAEHMVQHGHRVTVVTAFPHYPQWRQDASYAHGRRFVHWERQGVALRRGWVSIPRNRSARQRVAYDTSLAVTALLNALPLRSVDLVLSISPPLQLALTGALLAALVVLLLISAFFSSSETSMMAINRYRLRHLAKHGHRGARRTTRLLANTDKLLGVILLGNNLINAAAATLVTVITIRVFGQGELALGMATLAVTFVILVFSEVTPKVIGATYPEKIAFAASFVLTPLLKFAYPVVWFINLFVQGLLRLLRLRPVEESQDKRSGY